MSLRGLLNAADVPENLPGPVNKRRGAPCNGSLGPSMNRPPVAAIAGRLHSNTTGRCRQSPFTVAINPVRASFQSSALTRSFVYTIFRVFSRIHVLSCSRRPLRATTGPQRTSARSSTSRARGRASSSAGHPRRSGRRSCATSSPGVRLAPRCRSSSTSGSSSRAAATCRAVSDEGREQKTWKGSSSPPFTSLHSASASAASWLLRTSPCRSRRGSGWRRAWRFPSAPR